VIVISELADPGDAARVAAKVVEAFARPFPVAGQDLKMGASIGIALAPGDATDGATLLKHADTAMYQAKREGRCGYRRYS
jgi:diguanylate cyclase (GGDEF)-like protein